ncbi:M20 family metallopeptidase [Bradyrhizobium sp. JR3.5]
MGNLDAAVKAAWSAIDRERSYTTELTQRLVRIPSVNPKFVNDPSQNRESAVQDLVELELTSLGMSINRWDVFPDRPNIVGQLAGSEDRSLLLCGHIDVVPVGERGTWTVDPFGGEIKGGKLYGRGAVDMKSGVAAAVAAVRGIKAAGIELEGRLAIHSVVDEEAGGFGAIDAVKRGYLAKAAIITELTQGDIQICEGGLEWIRITITGRQGHSAWRYNEIWPQRDAPDRLRPAVNAIDIATRFLEALRNFEYFEVPHASAPTAAARYEHDQCRSDARRRGAWAGWLAAHHDQSRHHSGCGGHRPRLQIPASPDQGRDPL